MYTILRNSTAIYNAIKDLFSTRTRKCRRVIIVGFVGAEASALLPDVEGVELYCWPRGGATDPNAIGELDKREAKVFFVDKLHIKLYWVEGKGAVITSANLSKSAMGVGGLYEFGIYVHNPLDLKIDQIIQSLNFRPVTDAELYELHRQHDIELRRNPKRRQIPKKRPRAPKFIDWYRDRQKNWKLGWWEVQDEWQTALPILARAKKQYGIKSDIEDGLYCKNHQYREGEWILCFRLPLNNVKLEWMFIDIVDESPRNDQAYDKKYPCQAVQVSKRPRNLIEPFHIDQKFVDAFKVALQRYNRMHNIKRLHNLSPNEEFLEILIKAIRKKRR